MELHRRQVAFVLLCHYLLLTSMDAIQIGFPLHADGLGFHEGAIGLLAAVFTGGVVITRFVAWYLAHRKGPGAVLLLGVAVSAVVPLLYLLPRQPLPFAPVRFLHSLAPATFITGTLMLLVSLGPPQARSTLLGLHGAVSSFSFATAPALALWLMAPGRGAPWLYGVSSAVGIAAGIVMISTGLLHPSKGQVARMAPSGRVDFTLLTQPQVIRALPLVILAGMGLGGTLNFGALHALRLGLSRPEGLFIALALTGALARGLGGRLAAKLPPRGLVAGALTILALGMTAMAIASSSLQLLVAGALVGVGYGMTHISILAYLMDRVDPGQHWGTTTWFTTAYDMGLSTGPVLIGFLARAFTVSTGFLAVAGLALGGAALASRWLDRGQRPGFPPPAEARKSGEAEGSGGAEEEPAKEAEEAKDAMGHA